jgi:hypothetical protein
MDFSSASSLKFLFSIYSMMKLVLLLALATHANCWRGLSIPKPLGLSELMNRLQDATTTQVSNAGLVDQINQLISESAATISRSQNLVNGHLKELNVTNDIVNKTMLQVDENEAYRLALIRQYNKVALGLNSVQTDMMTGAQQINDVLGLSQRIKTNLANDIKRINDAINVTNDWLIKMDEWMTFMRSESDKIDQAQAGLVKWGDATKQNLNLHEVSATKLARETFDLETQISDVANVLLSSGNLIGYQPKTYTLPEVSGGLGWEYTFWS